MIEYTVRVTPTTTTWFLNGNLHRTDGPAVVDADGYKEWWLHGERHRTDGPAVTDADGYNEWYLNGNLHRTDGPAVTYIDGSNEWYINGVGVTEADVMSPTKEMTVAELEAVLGHKLKVVK